MSKKEGRFGVRVSMEDMTPAEEAFTRIFPNVMYDGFHKTMGLLIKTGVLELKSLTELKKTGEKPPIDIEACICACYLAMLRIASMDGAMEIGKAKMQLDKILESFMGEDTLVDGDGVPHKQEEGCGNLIAKAVIQKTQPPLRNPKINPSLPASPLV